MAYKRAVKRTPRKKTAAVTKSSVASREDELFTRVVGIIEAARQHVVRSVNTAMVQAYWFIGREIVEVEQHGAKRAGYGERIVENLAGRLTARFRRGFSVPNLRNMRQLFLTYPRGSALPEELGGPRKRPGKRSALPSVSQTSKIRSAAPWRATTSTSISSSTTRLLPCFVLVDLKLGKLTHQDLGQMQMYVNAFDRFQRAEHEAQTIGIVLCSEKNDAMVKITLPEDNEQILAARYQMYLPTEEELKAELAREREEAERMVRLAGGKNEP